MEVVERREGLGATGYSSGRCILDE